jgi:hypothetical protein
LIALVFIAASLVGQSSSAQQTTASGRTQEQRDSYRKAMEDADQKVAAEVQQHSELMKNLEYLTTQIGARLTGSPQMQQASDWTLKRFRDYAIDAHLETAQIEHGWTRGLESAEITSPIQKRIGIHALGWSKGTDAEVSSEVLLVNVKTVAELEPFKEKVKGKIVMLRKPADMAKIDPRRSIPLRTMLTTL